MYGPGRSVSQSQSMTDKKYHFWLVHNQLAARPALHLASLATRAHAPVGPGVDTPLPLPLLTILASLYEYIRW
jgi:hypothetical protein